MAYQSWSVVFGEQPSAAKWNILGTNDASFNDGTGIGSGTITNPKLTNSGSFDSSWAWASWTPTLVNLSGGTQNYAHYTQIGKTVFFRFKYTLAGAGVGGSVTFTLPVTADSDYVATDMIESTCGFRDATDSTVRNGAIELSSTTVAILKVFKTDGTYSNSANLSSTVPFTWASTDTITAYGSYEAA